MLLHQGCRDNEKVDMMRCKACGLVFANSHKHLKENLYQESGMHQSVDFTYEDWLQETKMDDMRRAKTIGCMLEHKSLRRDSTDLDILDFGCGNGGFLRAFRDGMGIGRFGVELENDVRRRLNEEGIVCKEKITEYDRKFDIITMFHVIEHLTEPKEWLRQIGEYLKEDGILILETPNAKDALLEAYGCSAFADFTFWSLHVYLYTSQTLEKVVREAGFSVAENRQIQRYPYTNHLYWILEGKPSGHKKLNSVYAEKFEACYEEWLREKGWCDTLWLAAKKPEYIQSV